MSIQYTYYCDGPPRSDLPGDPSPDGCPAHVQTTRTDGTLPSGFLRVLWYSDGHPTTELHFCCWDCVLRYAGQQHPVEIIECSEMS